MRPPHLSITTPFSRAEARAAGIPVSRLIGPRYTRVMFDAYVAAEVEVTCQLRARYVLSRCDPASWISHHTAADLWDLWVPDDPHVHVSVPEGGRLTRRRGVRPHVANPSSAVVLHRGLRVSGPCQTFLDLAGTLDLVDLVVLGDSLLHRGLATRQVLVDAADAWGGHGARVARRAARLVRDGVDSRMETRLRLLVVLAGLPEPVVNHKILREDGRVRFRLDLSWPRVRIALEYDGRHHAESDGQWQSDIDRREALDRLRWRLIVVRAPGLFVEPARTLERIVGAFADRGVIVRVRGDEWRRHFPGRTAA